MAQILKPRDRRPMKAEPRPKPGDRTGQQAPGRDCDR